MPRSLKVFRTAVGFHDAYIAAPSRKAALAAWGAQKDLFARGAAEEVTDPALVGRALARPGEVVLEARGPLPAGEVAPARRTARPSPKARPQPPPSRAALDKVQAGLQAFEAEAERSLGEIDARISALQQERAALARRLGQERKRREAQVSKAEAAHAAKLRAWRAAQD